MSQPPCTIGLGQRPISHLGGVIPEQARQWLIQKLRVLITTPSRVSQKTRKYLTEYNDHDLKGINS